MGLRERPYNPLHPGGFTTHLGFEGYPLWLRKPSPLPLPRDRVGLERLFTSLVWHHLSVPFTSIMVTPFGPLGLLGLTTRDALLPFPIGPYKPFPYGHSVPFTAGFYKPFRPVVNGTGRPLAGSVLLRFGGRCPVSPSIYSFSGRYCPLSIDYDHMRPSFEVVMGLDGLLYR